MKGEGCLIPITQPVCFSYLYFVVCVWEWETGIAQNLKVEQIKRQSLCCTTLISAENWEEPKKVQIKEANFELYEIDTWSH